MLIADSPRAADPGQGTVTEAPTGPPPLDLVVSFCEALSDCAISYCHWKSNNAIDRSTSGDNDLDLLVGKADESRITELLCRYGFREAEAPPDKRMPGVQDYFGYDEATNKWVHAHVHYQLVLGHDLTKNYRLPLERPFLESAVQGPVFKVPEPEFEFVVFVVRMILKHSTWYALLAREGRLSRREREELAWLQNRIDPARVAEILTRHAPYISESLFARCLEALQPGASAWTRGTTGSRLEACLQAHARRSPVADTVTKVARRLVIGLRRRILKSKSRYRLRTGGMRVALVGGDGAGKSTAIAGLSKWLSGPFATLDVHLGKPAWSWTTLGVRTILKVGQLMGLYPLEASFEQTLTQRSRVSPALPWLLREVCRARDRYHRYVKAQRFAADGGVVIFDRFPLDQIQLMDGPQTRRFLRLHAELPEGRRFGSLNPANRLVRSLVALEESYYRRMAQPELLIVLRVDPSIAVRRKPEEDPESVRLRSTEIWKLNWQDSGALVVDASRSTADVLRALKAHVWARV